MSLYSSAYLKNLSANKTSYLKGKLYTESRTLAGFDIFLSHSFLDKEEVEGLYIELTNLGYTVYVDWIVDPHLDRNNITKESATLIRNRMKSSKSLLLAISTNASMSKWMPWELGYVDGHTNKCAIIPVSKNPVAPKSFKGTEYLLLYPFIKKLPIAGQITEKLWVIESEYNYTIFDNWFLTGKLEENRSINIFEL